jgi:hypothetical protein
LRLLLLLLLLLLVLLLLVVVLLHIRPLHLLATATAWQGCRQAHGPEPAAPVQKPLKRAIRPSEHNHYTAVAHDQDCRVQARCVDECGALDGGAPLVHEGVLIDGCRCGWVANVFGVHVPRERRRKRCHGMQRRRRG